MAAPRFAHAAIPEDAAAEDEAPRRAPGKVTRTSRLPPRAAPRREAIGAAAAPRSAAPLTGPPVDDPFALHLPPRGGGPVSESIDQLTAAITAQRGAIRTAADTQKAAITKQIAQARPRVRTRAAEVRGDLAIAADQRVLALAQLKPAQRRAIEGERDAQLEVVGADARQATRALTTVFTARTADLAEVGRTWSALASVAGGVGAKAAEAEAATAAQTAAAQARAIARTAGRGVGAKGKEMLDVASAAGARIGRIIVSAGATAAGDARNAGDGLGARFFREVHDFERQAAAGQGAPLATLELARGTTADAIRDLATSAIDTLEQAVDGAIGDCGALRDRALDDVGTADHHDRAMAAAEQRGHAMIDHAARTAAEPLDDDERALAAPELAAQLGRATVDQRAGFVAEGQARVARVGQAGVGIVDRAGPIVCAELAGKSEDTLVALGKRIKTFHDGCDRVELALRGNLDQTRRDALAALPKLAAAHRDAVSARVRAITELVQGWAPAFSGEFRVRVGALTGRLTANRAALATEQQRTIKLMEREVEQQCKTIAREGASTVAKVVGFVVDQVSDALTALSGFFDGIVRSIGAFVAGLATALADLMLAGLDLVNDTLRYWKRAIAEDGLVLGTLEALLYYLVGGAEILLKTALLLIAGIVLMAVGIVVNLYTAIVEGDELTLFERWQLIGRAAGDVFILLLPFLKEKLGIPGLGELIKRTWMREAPAPEVPQAPEVPKAPEAPKAPETPKLPEAPEAPQTPKVPEAPEAPKVPEAPAAVDPLADLGRKHGLPPAAVEVLRASAVDPVVIDRMLGRGVAPAEIARLATDYGPDGVRAIDTLVQRGVAEPAAEESIHIARDVGVAAEVQQLVNGGNLENPGALQEAMRKISKEVANGQRGAMNELLDAADRARRGNRVSIGGRTKVAGDPASGQADVIDHTARQAIQMKTVTSGLLRGVMDNLRKALDQLGGSGGEHPPDGYQRIADIRITNPQNEIYASDRVRLQKTLRGRLTKNIGNLDGPGAAPGVIRITNGSGTFDFTAAEVR